MVDYLCAPMPFLVGLPSDMLPLIRHIPMSEVTTVDLDLQRVIPPGGDGGVAGSGVAGAVAAAAAGDDGRLLPYGRQLAAALEAVFKTVRSPTEYESSHLITGACYLGVCASCVIIPSNKQVTLGQGADTPNT